MTSSSEPSIEILRDNSAEWEVQDILAVRTSASGDDEQKLYWRLSIYYTEYWFTTGDDEVLVVWKPSWTPASNVRDGPGLRRFQAATKWKFTSAVSGMRVILPVEPGTQLAQDHALMQKMADAEKRKGHRNSRSQVHAQDPRSIGPRKSVGSVAKRKLQKQPADCQDSSAS
jgi:hypothetical protein